MTLPSATLDLCDCPTTVAIERLKRVRHTWANAITSGYSEMVAKWVSIAIEEVNRNTLHGDHAIIRLISLPDGSVVLIATDVEGIDHLDPTGVSVGIAIITGIVGEENFIFQHNGNVYETYLRIDPASIAARLA